MMTTETTLPGISSYKGHPAPVKITNVQLQGGSSGGHGWSTQVQYTAGDDATLPSDPHRGNNGERNGIAVIKFVRVVHV